MPCHSQLIRRHYEEESKVKGDKSNLTSLTPSYAQVEDARERTPHLCPVPCHSPWYRRCVCLGIISILWSLVLVEESLSRVGIQPGVVTQPFLHLGCGLQPLPSPPSPQLCTLYFTALAVVMAQSDLD